MARRQKFKAHIDIPTRNVPSIPERYATQARELAEELAIEARGNLSLLESSGVLALAILFEQLAAGQLEPTQGFSFLKGLAEKKTSAPVQKMEVESKTDMRVLIAGAIEQNSTVMKEALVKALADREAIRERLKLTSAMELETVGTATGGDGMASPSLPHPPLEVDEDAERRIRESNTPFWRRATE